MIAPFSMVLLGYLVASGCGSKRTGVVVHRGEVKALEDCKVRVENVFQNEKTRFAALEVACGVTTGPNWWGIGKQPLAFTLSLGDCTLLKKRFYCVTALDVDQAVTLESTYRFDGRSTLTREP
jgi:hypothetical protein